MLSPDFQIAYPKLKRKASIMHRYIDILVHTLVFVGYALYNRKECLNLLPYLFGRIIILL